VNRCRIAIKTTSSGDERLQSLTYALPERRGYRGGRRVDKEIGMDGDIQRHDGDDDGPSGAGAAGMERLLSHLNGYSAVTLLSLGHRCGLLAALLEGGGTAAEVARRAGTHERSTEEWLAGMTAAGYACHDKGVFAFVEGQDEVFRPGMLPFDVTVLLEVKDKFATLLGRIADSMRDGKGVPYAAYQPEFSAAQDRLNAPLYEQHLIEDFVASVGGAVEVLDAGAQVADIGCGGGQALTVLAARFPRSSFTGYDIDEDALQIGRVRVAESGLDNVQFVWGDAAGLDLGHSMDLVLAVDAIHDQGRPEDVLRSVLRSLRPTGAFIMVEPLATGDIDADTGRPRAAMAYTSSLGHCVQVSLAAGGPGLGSMWGRAKAIPMLRVAGFREVSVHESPSDYAVYCARP
jgi:ubiquinone/menaquinone biosynthesis C-methylase UbiE